MIRPKRLGLLFLILFGGSLPSVLLPDTILSVSSIFTGEHFTGGGWPLLYFLAPIVSLSGCLFVFIPGLLFTLLINAAKRLDLWIPRALGMSIIIISVAVTVAQQWLGKTMTARAFVILILAISALLFLMLLFRVLRGDSIDWPLEKNDSHSIRFELLLTIGIPALVVIVLAPKFFLENLNGDGAHLLESSRLLFFQPLPFWSETAGPLSTYPGFTSMLSVYPLSWFLRLFGVCEAAARLPILLYLAGLFPALLSMIRHDREKSPGNTELLLIAGNILLFTVVVAFNCTYNPYMADIALPGARETLYMFCFISYLVSFLRKEKAWMIFFLCLTFLVLPTTQLLIGLWMLSAFFLLRPRPWKELILSGAVFCICLLLNAAAPFLLTSLGLPVPGREFSLEALQFRLNFGFPVPRRVMYWIIPCGIVPAISMLAWRKQDSLNRTISTVIILYFLFFLMQEHTALHHFVPAMILPVVVFWRSGFILYGPHRKGILTITAFCILISIILSLPTHFQTDQSNRVIGESIEDRTSGYESMNPKSFSGAMLLQDLFPGAWKKEVPKQSYGGSWNVWYYYAHHAKSRTRSINYVLQPVNETLPNGATLVSRNEDVALYVLSTTVWESHKKMRPPSPIVSWFYRVPRRTLFAGNP